MKLRKAAASLGIALMLTPFLVPPLAQAERLVTSLSTHQVLITSNFTGTSLVLFGIIEDAGVTKDNQKKYDVAVTVRGPKTTFVTRKKDRVLGLWVNYESRRYPDTPSYLAVITNRPPAEFGTLELLTKHKLGLAYAALPPRIAADEEFSAALLRVKKAEGLFHEVTNGVTILAPTAFRATLPIPGTAPTGAYEIDVQVFLNGALVAEQSTAIEVVKIGYEADVAVLARDSRLEYGLGVALLAFVVGSVAGLVFRRG